jgi:hypothetical protein
MSLTDTAPVPTHKRLGDVLDTEEFRTTARSTWVPGDQRRYHGHEDSFVEVRTPVRELTETLTESWEPGDGYRYSVVSAGSRNNGNRGNIDSYEYADIYNGTWRPCSSPDGAVYPPDDFPVITRRPV